MKKIKVFRLFLLILILFIVVGNQALYALSMPEFTINVDEKSSKKGLKLEGEWLFFPNKLYTASEAIQFIGEAQKVNIPTTYKNSIKQTDGFGTFVTKVNVPEALIGTIQAVRLPYQHAAINISINDHNIISAGKVATSPDQYTKMQGGPIGYYEVKEESFYVVVQLSSYGILKSGFSGAITIGDPDELMKHKQKDFYVVVFLLGILIFVGCFSIFIGIVGKQKRVLMYLGLFALAIMLRCVITAPFLYTEILLPFTITEAAAIRIEYFLSLVIGYFLMSYLVALYRELFKMMIIHFNYFVYMVTAIIILVIPSDYIQNVFTVFVALQASLMGYLMKVLFKAYKLKYRFASMNIISIFLLGTSLVFELLSAYNIIPLGPYVLLVLTCISVLLAQEFGKFYIQQNKELQILNDQLSFMNGTLDELVQVRTNELTVLNMKLKNQAIIDALTGIYNRSYLNEKLEDYFNEAKTKKEKLALVIFDIDEFKQYNDTMGHLEGDKILATITQIIKDELPKETFFARYGGEEFVILFKNFECEDVKLYCEMIRKKVEAANIDHPHSQYKYVTISLGGAFMDKQHPINNSTEMLEKADRQLYHSKGTGKNKSSFI